MSSQEEILLYDILTALVKPPGWILPPPPRCRVRYFTPLPRCRVRYSPPPAAGLDTSLSQLWLSMEHHECIRIGAPPHNEAWLCFELRVN